MRFENNFWKNHRKGDALPWFVCFLQFYHQRLYARPHLSFVRRNFLTRKLCRPRDEDVNLREE